MVIGIFAREGVKYLARNLYTVLRFQDRVIDKAYRKAGLYNRGVVKGVQHGLVAGQVIGGTLNLGLPGDIENGLPQKPKFPSSRKYSKTRSRYKYDNRSTNKYRAAKFGNRHRQPCSCKCC